MLFAVLLILLGALLLLVNLGVVGAEIWWALLSLWPVALIAIGLDLVVGRRSTAARVGVAAVSLGVVAVGLFVLTAGDSPATPERTTIAHASGDAERAEITLEPGVGRLDLASTDDEDVLLAGSVTAPSGVTVVDERADVAGSAEIRVALEGRGWSPFGVRGSRDVPTWDLRLGQAAPVVLTVEGGVGESRLDLRDAWLDGLSIETGVGRTTVTLPAAGDLDVEIRGGVGEVIVLVPAQMAARIVTETGVGALEIAGPWEDDGTGRLRSADWDAATDRVELSVRAGVGRVQIRGADRP